MAPAPKPAKKGFNLTKKAGPLPVWAWAAIALIGGYLLYEHYKGTSSSATSAIGSTPSAANDSGTDSSGSGSGSSGTPDIPDTSATTPYGHQGFSDQSSALLTALDAETQALGNLSQNANGSAPAPSTTTTNNYYPVEGSGANGSTAAPQTIAQQAAAIAATQGGGSTAYKVAVDTAALKGQVLTENSAGDTVSASTGKAVVSTAPPANSAAAVKAKAQPTTKIDATASKALAAKNARAG